MPTGPKWRGRRAARHGATGPCAADRATSCPWEAWDHGVLSSVIAMGQTAKWLSMGKIHGFSWDLMELIRIYDGIPSGND